MDEAEFKPLVSFPDQSESFVLGFEAGMLWRRMEDGEEVITGPTPYHSENVHGVFQAMADAAGYDIEATECADHEGEWTEATFHRRKVVKAHLSLVHNKEARGD